MPASVPTISTPSPAAPNTALFAKPGESILDYEARLGSASGGGVGTGFGTPQPVAAKLVPPSQGGTQGLPDSADALGTAQDKAAIAAGYTSYQDAVSKLTAPSQDTTDFYNSAYSAAGLDALQTKINQKNTDLNTALGTINDNPWLDEASRVGRSRSLQTLAEGDIKNLTTEYNAKLKSVHDLVSNHSKDVSTTEASNKAKLAFLEAQAKAGAAQTNLQTKNDNAAPKTIKGANGATFRWNPATGNFDQIIAGKSGGGSSGPFAFTPKQTTTLESLGLPAQHATTILGEIQQGYPLDQIRQQLRDSKIDPAVLDTMMYYIDPKNNTPAKSKSTSSSGGRTL